MTILKKLTAVCLLLTATGSWAHVSLTFPPARSPDLDFLDNVRTPLPCGVPRGDVRTSLLAGSTFNVTWHVALPHMGGFRIEVLNEKEKPILNLTPTVGNSSFVLGDVTTQRYEVKLPPGFECRNCTLRIIRQAAEYGNNYQFFSCADVDIISRPGYRETCSGHGKDIAGRCRCNHLYYGAKCQYRDECAEDKDCGRHARCVDVSSVTFPRKQCFCEMGWFGPGCSKQSPLKNPSVINYADYRKVELSDQFTLYWRILANLQELEVAMVVQGSSYAAVGWRPLSITPACKAFPLLEDPAGFELDIEPEPIPEASPVPERVTEAVPEPESSPEPQSEPAPEPEASPEPQSEPVPQPEASPEPVSDTELEVDPQSDRSSDTSDIGTEAEIARKADTVEPHEHFHPEAEPNTPTTTEITTKRAFTKPGIPVLSTRARTSSTTTTTTTTTTRAPTTAATESTVKTTTKKLSPLDKLIAKSRQTSTTSTTTTVEPHLEQHGFHGTASEVRISDLPEGAVDASAGSRKRRQVQDRDGGSSDHLETNTKEMSPVSEDDERQGRALDLPQFPGPRQSNPAPGTPVGSRPGFSKLSGSDGWIPVPPREFSDVPDTPAADSPPAPQPTAAPPAPGTTPVVVQPQPTTENQATPKLQNRVETDAVDHSHPEGEHDAESTPEPEPEPSPEPQPEPEPSPEPESEAAGHDHAAGHSHDHGHVHENTSGHEGHTHQHAATPQVVTKKRNYTPKSDFHAMDCTDIVIGMARGNLSRIGDYYSRDRSTPKLDTSWGGRQDLTAALGYEADGKTVIIFRRKLNGTDETDHVIGTEPMHVIWARGQEPGKDSHDPSALKKDNVSMTNFYETDALKYHGKGSQRGVINITFLETQTSANNVHHHHQGAGHNHGSSHQHKTGAFCGGEWKYPVDCDLLAMDCLYYAKWEYINRLDSVRFTIRTNYTNKWAGIGFSDTAIMPGTDVILGWVDSNGRVFVGDMWALGYTSPRLDESQDLTNITGKIEEGKMTVSFIRKRSTKDKTQDSHFTDDACLFMKYPIQGGTYNAVNKRISKHLSTPIVSADRVCIRSCGNDDDPSKPLTYTTTESPPRTVYAVELKLTGLARDFEVPQPETPEFNELSNRLTRSIRGALNTVGGIEDVAVQNFVGGDQQLVAQMSVIMKKLETEETKASVEKALQEAIASGSVGNIQVDPSFLRVQQLDDVVEEDPEVKPDRPWTSRLSATSLWTVVGCIVALVILAIIQAACTIHKAAKKPAPPPPASKDRLMSNWAWKDYASTNHGYEPFGSDDLNRTMGTNGSTPLGVRTLPNESRAPSRPKANGSTGPRVADRGAYSLPRTNQPPPGQNRSYRGPPDASAHVQPDFYFMPSQRRYSGYLDYPQ